MEIQNQVREFVLTNFYVANPDSLSNEMSLIDQGIIDSTGMLEVILFIEDSLGIAVDERELLPENFESIERITNFVVRKKDSQSMNQMSSVQ
jgi:acyl carrier protein